MNNCIDELSLLVRSTSVGSYLIIFPYANRVDPGLGLIWLHTRLKASLGSKGLKCIFSSLNDCV